MSTKCDYINGNGKPCKKWAVLGDTRCEMHGGEKKGQRPRAEPCSFAMSNGEPCRGWAVIGSNPPLCVAHSGLRNSPRGRDNGGWRHGFYEKGDPNALLEGTIEDLFKKQERAADLLDLIQDPHDLLRLLSIHFKNASVIGKLLRDKQMLEGEDDDLLKALGPALDLIRDRLAADSQPNITANQQD